MSIFNETMHRAFCELTPGGIPITERSSEVENEVHGFVYFTQSDESKSSCVIEYRLTGLSPGEHGFHM